ncbi:MAG: hypothetical protein GXP53_03685 [Deltaproteobacteria bacterium]|nr:hypothetical protein [Deltaproteobacteria bacterium]
MQEILARKRMIFTIRLLLIIITAYVMLFTPSGREHLVLKAFFIAFYLASDLIVAALPERFFSNFRLFYLLICFDTIVVAAGIWLSGQAGSDFYLIYFLIISLSTLSSRLRYLMLNAFIFAGVYGWLLFQQGLLSDDLAVGYCLRIPFIVIISLFYGFVVKSVRSDKESELRRTNKMLVETRNQLIQKDKMASLGRLASGIAHEIRNPLEIISMGVDYLDNLMPDGRPEAKKAVDRIFAAIERANAIIEDVLKFSRKTEFVIEPVNIGNLVADVLDMAGHSLKRADVGVEKEFSDPRLCAAASRNMLSQIILNIINNAVDAMEKAPVKRLKIRIYMQKVNNVGYKTGYRRADYFRVGDNMIVLEISDTGKGMPEDVMMKIFEPFFTTKQTGRGTGLGLSLAHMIIDRMRGTIDVSSQDGIGTTFYVKLQPAADGHCTKEEDVGKEKNSHS